MKMCSKCKSLKPLEEFYNYKASKDGKMYRCKQFALFVKEAQIIKVLTRIIIGQCRLIEVRN